MVKISQKTFFYNFYSEHWLTYNINLIIGTHQLSPITYNLTLLINLIIYC